MLSDTILPALYPLFVCYGVLCLGWPGVGEIPALIAMLLVMGRFHIHRLQEEGVPGRRRAKSLDSFRQYIGYIYEGIFLDDPNRERIFMADLKSFFPMEEEQTTSGRYNDSKLPRNCVRTYASNNLHQKDEPADDNRTSITGKEFLKLARRIFAGDRLADVLACLKRAVVIVLGQHAMYLRLPSQDSRATVHRIKVDDLYKDLLSEKDKPLYSKYTLGIMEHGPEWQDETAREVRVISAGMEKFAAGRPETYIAAVNGEIEEQLIARLLPLRLPNKEIDSSSDQEDVLPSPPVMAPNPGARCNRLGRFKLPPAKQYSGKTTQRGEPSNKPPNPVPQAEREEPPNPGPELSHDLSVEGQAQSAHSAEDVEMEAALEELIDNMPHEDEVEEKPFQHSPFRRKKPDPIISA